MTEFLFPAYAYTSSSNHRLDRLVVRRRSRPHRIAGRGMTVKWSVSMVFRVYRRILFVLWLLPALHGIAQKPIWPAGSAWQNVMALPVGTRIVVKAKSRHLTCNLKAVDTETLTCGPHGALGNPKDVVLQQAEIKLIKIKRRARSVLIDTGIGAGSGAILGIALTANQPSVFFGANDWRGTITAGMAIGLGGIGAIVGAVTDSASSTIYKAP